MTGEDEEWVLLYEVANEPNVQVLDVPNLIPYTYYRWDREQYRYLDFHNMNRSHAILIDFYVKSVKNDSKNRGYKNAVILSLAFSFWCVPDSKGWSYLRH